MNLEKVKKFCRSFPSASEENIGKSWNILMYLVEGKKFAYFKTSDPEKWRFSIRVTPERFVELTDLQGVKPARYMGRFHWVTIVDVASFDETYLKELIKWSYQKALSSLPKKVQNQISEFL